MADVPLTLTVTEQELECLEDYCQQTSQSTTDVIRDYIRSIQQHSKEQLLSEIARLHQQLEEVQQEKADLEVLLETMATHSSIVEAELQDEAEEARRESEERFRAITEATPVPILIWRLSDGEILYANAASSTAFGCSVDELLGRPSLELYVDPSDYQRLLDVFFKDGSVQNYELHCQKADRTLFRVTVSLRSLTFNGEPTILGAFNDITDLKQAEEAFQQAKEQLEAVLNAVPGSISWIGANGIYLGVNRYLAESLNLAPEALIGKEVGFLNNRSPFTEFMQQFLTSPDMAASQEIAVKGKDSVRYYLIAAQKYQQGGAAVTVGIDITERKQAEEALRIAEENYRSIFENALEGIFQSTPDGHYINVNPAMARIYGYDSPEDMINSITEIGTQIYVEPQGRDEFLRLMAEHGQLKNWEYRAYRKDGSIVWVEEDTRAVRDTTGKLLYYEGIIQEITQRKQEEEALKRQVEELQIEIDQQKRSREVAQITQTDYFQELQAAVENLRLNFDEDDF
jgi:PAS domain S-box-containing protein